MSEPGNLDHFRGSNRKMGFHLLESVGVDVNTC